MSENISIELLGRQVAELRQRLESGGGPPNDGGMDARIAKLENDVAAIKDSLSRLEPMLRERFGTIEGKLSHMPTLMQIGLTVLSINAGIVAVASLIVLLLRTAAS